MTIHPPPPTLYEETTYLTPASTFRFRFSLRMLSTESSTEENRVLAFIRPETLAKQNKPGSLKQKLILGGAIHGLDQVG